MKPAILFVAALAVFALLEAKPVTGAAFESSRSVTPLRKEYYKEYSQRTYTLFADGHYERKTCYTDGSCDALEQGMWHVPGKGDLKHREEVWRNGSWVATVSQYY